MLSPCPLPPLEKKCYTELGLFRSRGGARLGENSPFLGLLDVKILKIYIKSVQSGVIRKWVKAPGLFLTNGKINKQMLVLIGPGLPPRWLVYALP